MLLRVQVAIIVFAAAYLSEILRGGLQAFLPTSANAAAALGMGPLQIEGYIVLPQVFRAVAPSLANNAMALFKDTSLVTVVSLYELHRQPGPRPLRRPPVAPPLPGSVDFHCGGVLGGVRGAGTAERGTEYKQRAGLASLHHHTNPNSINNFSPKRFLSATREIHSISKNSANCF